MEWNHFVRALTFLSMSIPTFSPNSPSSFKLQYHKYLMKISFLNNSNPLCPSLSLLSFRVPSFLHYFWFNNATADAAASANFLKAFSKSHKICTLWHSIDSATGSGYWCVFLRLAFPPRGCEIFIMWCQSAHAHAKVTHVSCMYVKSLQICQSSLFQKRTEVGRY